MQYPKSITFMLVNFCCIQQPELSVQSTGQPTPLRILMSKPKICCCLRFLVVFCRHLFVSPKESVFQNSFQFPPLHPPYIGLSKWHILKSLVRMCLRGIKDLLQNHRVLRVQLDPLGRTFSSRTQVLSPTPLTLDPSFLLPFNGPPVFAVTHGVPMSTLIFLLCIERKMP